MRNTEGFNQRSEDSDWNRLWDSVAAMWSQDQLSKKKNKKKRPNGPRRSDVSMGPEG